MNYCFTGFKGRLHRRPRKMYGLSSSLITPSPVTLQQTFCRLELDATTSSIAHWIWNNERRWALLWARNREWLFAGVEGIQQTPALVRLMAGGLESIRIMNAPIHRSSPYMIDSTGFIRCRDASRGSDSSH
ncbi:hypothetical protein CEXT_776961 [Caerostris extrusa]|uniref:Uncharacterized protein n=1 Tax=Caerostris extrusa TaxID=172846 RepID=A0AAV4SI91_CAEEX|nr:hypothetical protein CEXT_776961 [Caerostris extrusa]